MHNQGIAEYGTSIYAYRRLVAQDDTGMPEHNSMDSYEVTLPGWQCVP